MQSSLLFAIIFILYVIFSMTKRSYADLGHSNRASSFKSWLFSIFCCWVREWVFFNFSRLITIFPCLFCVYLHLLRTSQKIAQNVSDMRAKVEHLPSHTWLNRHTNTFQFFSLSSLDAGSLHFIRASGLCYSNGNGIALKQKRIQWILTATYDEINSKCFIITTKL